MKACARRSKPLASSTGREVEIHVIDIVRVADGKIVEHGTAWTGSGCLRSSAPCLAPDTPPERGLARVHATLCG
jgi:hypothetical protein